MILNDNASACTYKRRSFLWALLWRRKASVLLKHKGKFCDNIRSYYLCRQRLLFIIQTHSKLKWCSLLSRQFFVLLNHHSIWPDPHLLPCFKNISTPSLHHFRSDIMYFLHPLTLFDAFIFKYLGEPDASLNLQFFALFLYCFLYNLLIWYFYEYIWE